jgi:hypothetical protein
MNARSSNPRLSVFIIIVTLLVLSLACGSGSTDNGLNVETQVALTLDAMNNLPVEATAEATCTTVEFNGISVCYDPGIAQGTSTTIVPAVSSTDNPWYNVPKIEQIDFTNYATGEKFHSPRIMVFSVAEYKALYDKAEERISELQQYIANKPNIPADEIPFLPNWNAAQLFKIMPAFINFQNGQGIRFLTEYGQYAAPVNNTDLFYTFQGITNDGNYYVSVILPVTHPSLPADYKIDQAQQEELYNDYQGYLGEIIPTLSAQPLGSYTPDLALLDAMIQSMTIHQ